MKKWWWKEFRIDDIWCISFRGWVWSQAPRTQPVQTDAWQRLSGFLLSALQIIILTFNSFRVETISVKSLWNQKKIAGTTSLLQLSFSCFSSDHHNQGRAVEVCPSKGFEPLRLWGQIGPRHSSLTSSNHTFFLVYYRSTKHRTINFATNCNESFKIQEILAHFGRKVICDQYFHRNLKGEATRVVFPVRWLSTVHFWCFQSYNFWIGDWFSIQRGVSGRCIN